MLAPSEMFAGKLGDAKGLTLMLPSNHRDLDVVLIADVGEEKYAFFLEGSNKFHAFECTNNPHYGGILIPGVRIEICERSTGEEIRNWTAGTLVRADSKLLVSAREEHFSGTYLVPLQDNLPGCSSRCSVGFSKWQITIGEGVNKRVLHTVSLGE